MADIGIVEQYWGGVAKRLQAEVDVFNGLIIHNGEMGRENEQSLVRLLENLLPQNLGVGSGIIFDSQGNRSAQTDIIVYETNHHPKLLAQTNQILFPVETVRMAVEIKTTIDNEAIADFAKKSKLMSKLNPANLTNNPLFCLFGYHVSGAPTNIVKELHKLEFDETPDIFSVVDPGIFGQLEQSSFRAGLVPLHDIDDSGKRISKTWKSVDPKHPDSYLHFNGVTYPTLRKKAWGSDRICGEPGRALLLFCDALLRKLSDQHTVYNEWLSNYIPELARELIEVTPDS